MDYGIPEEFDCFMKIYCATAIYNGVTFIIYAHPASVDFEIY